MKPYIVLSLLALTTAQNSSDILNTTEITSNNETTTDLPAPNYDYVLKIGYNLDELKVPRFLVELIYDEDPINFSTNDVLILYGVKNISLTTTIEVLRRLNIATDKIFSLKGFETILAELDIKFSDWYNYVVIDKLKIKGAVLKDILETLSINVSNFSSGISFGEPDPYEEFKKGNFTKESLEIALNKANKTLEELFAACREEFTAKAVTLERRRLTNILEKYDFDEHRAVELWNLLNVTMQNVYDVAAFRDHLSTLSVELNRFPSIAILTGPGNITTNKEVYRDLARKVEKVAKAYAGSLENDFILDVDRKLSDSENIVILKSALLPAYEASSLSYAKTSATVKNLLNCKFVTFHNGSVVALDIPEANNKEEYFEIPRLNVSELVLGSPLVCDGKVYGLARKIDSDQIILDSFYSGASETAISCVFLSVTAVISVYILK